MTASFMYRALCTRDAHTRANDSSAVLSQERSFTHIQTCDVSYHFQRSFKESTYLTYPPPRLVSQSPMQEPVNGSYHVTAFAHSVSDTSPVGQSLVSLRHVNTSSSARAAALGKINYSGAALIARGRTLCSRRRHRRHRPLMTTRHALCAPAQCCAAPMKNNVRVAAIDQSCVACHAWAAPIPTCLGKRLRPSSKKLDVGAASRSMALPPSRPARLVNVLLIPPMHPCSDLFL